MDYDDILSGVAMPDMDKATTVASHNLKFYFDEFDEDDFPSDDYHTIDFHQDELCEMAAEQIMYQLISVFFKLEIARDVGTTVTERPLSRRIVFNDVKVQSNIVENFDPVRIVLDVWLDAQEADSEHSYSILMK